MGEAKRRGTKEERARAAIERNALEAQARQRAALERAAADRRWREEREAERAKIEAQMTPEEREQVEQQKRNARRHSAFGRRGLSASTLLAIAAGSMMAAGPK